jgi:hypothetical protein
MVGCRGAGMKANSNMQNDPWYEYTTGHHPYSFLFYRDKHNHEHKISK